MCTLRTKRRRLGGGRRSLVRRTIQSISVRTLRTDRLFRYFERIAGRVTPNTTATLARFSSHRCLGLQRTRRRRNRNAAKLPPLHLPHRRQIRQRHPRQRQRRKRRRRQSRRLSSNRKKRTRNESPARRLSRKTNPRPRLAPARSLALVPQDAPVCLTPADITSPYCGSNHALQHRTRATRSASVSTTATAPAKSTRRAKAAPAAPVDDDSDLGVQAPALKK